MKQTGTRNEIYINEKNCKIKLKDKIRKCLIRQEQTSHVDAFVQGQKLAIETISFGRISYRLSVNALLSPHSWHHPHTNTQRIQTKAKTGRELGKPSVARHDR